MIDKVTSLFDLYLKAQTQEPYRQLTVLVAKKLSYRAFDPASLEEAKEYLDRVAIYAGSCSCIVEEANLSRSAVQDDRNPEEMPKEDKTFRAKLSKLKMADERSQADSYQQISTESLLQSIEAVNRSNTILSFANHPIPLHNDNSNVANFIVPTVSPTNNQSDAAQTDQPAGWPFTPVRPGDLVECGWYDQEIEDEIASHMRAHELSRDEAIIRVFNTPAESGA